MLRHRLLTALVAIPILLWLIFGAPVPIFRGVILAFTLIGLLEYFYMAFPGRVALQGIGVASGGLIAFGMGEAPPESALNFSAGLMAFVTVGLIGSLFHSADPAKAITNLGYTLLGILYAGAFLPHFIWLRLSPEDVGPVWITFVLAVAMGGDSAGYFAGRAFGKRLLMPSVSPKKTVEGALGAVGGNLLAGSIVKWIGLPDVGWVEIAVLSIAAGILAQVGDLCESLLKRAFGTKDSGWLLPGHGGILDRADSLVFPIVLVYYYVNFFRVAG